MYNHQVIMRLLRIFFIKYNESSLPPLTFVLYKIFLYIHTYSNSGARSRILWNSSPGVLFAETFMNQRKSKLSMYFHRVELVGNVTRNFAFHYISDLGMKPFCHTQFAKNNQSFQSGEWVLMPHPASIFLVITVLRLSFFAKIQNTTILRYNEDRKDPNRLSEVNQ